MISTLYCMCAALAYGRLTGETPAGLLTAFFALTVALHLIKSKRAASSAGSDV